MPAWPKLPAVLPVIAAVIAGTIALSFSPAHAAPSAPAGNVAPDALCHHAVTAAEELTGIPQDLMRAISLVESGIFLPEAGGRVAWPWTVMAQGRGRYFRTREDAVEAVRGLLKAGVANIDVGCMQVNLQYHGLAFSSLEEAFDPVTNVAYAASFLLDLKNRHGNWDKAVRHYHSATPARNQPYRRKVRAELVALRKDGKPMSAADHTRLASQYAPDRDGQDSQPLGKAPYGGVMAEGHPAQPLLNRTGNSPVAALPKGAPNVTDEDGGRLSYLKSAHWPPRSLKAQYQVEHNARARVMFPKDGKAPSPDKPLFNPFLNKPAVQNAESPNPS